MSDVANLVEGFLSVVGLTEENTALRRQLRDARAVTIAGPHGRPVFARAQLDEDSGFSGRESSVYTVPFF